MIATRRRWLLSPLLMLSTPAAARAWDVALPGYRYRFPQDHFSHPSFRTEWWYYTGNLRERGGAREFGYELTFFRQGMDRSNPAGRGGWHVDNVWLAHLALSDLQEGRFLHTERLNRAGPLLAGADGKSGRIWNGNWETLWRPEGSPRRLQAIDARFRLSLEFESRKPPVVHGRDGVHQKAAGRGEASHYISFTRLLTAGSLELEGRRFDVTGSTWMDHEFFTNSLSAGQLGWDWMSLQLDDDSELMLYRFRRKDGQPDPFSSGTYVDSTGAARHLGRGDFVLEPLAQGRRWRSPVSGGEYPLEWRIQAPTLGIDLHLTTPLESQEIATKTKVAPSYWEGAVRLRGTRAGRPLSGLGYLEMTGYDRPVNLNR